MRRTAIMLAGFVILLTLAASAQEDRSEISLEGTGFFTRDTSGQGVSRTTSDTGGFLLGYRYHINRWIAAEGDYGFDRNTQKYFGSLGESRVQANVHAVTGDVVVNLPLPIRKVSAYALAGGGSLIFDPTGNNGGFVPGAGTQARGAFLYGAGADYALTRHFSLRAEYRGYVYKDPDFGLRTSALEHRQLDAHGATIRWNRLSFLEPPGQSGDQSLPPSFPGCPMIRETRVTRRQFSQESFEGGIWPPARFRERSEYLLGQPRAPHPQSLRLIIQALE